ncbi:MAG: thioredoxin-dependent thiol peroxidase [Cyanobacteria bacterium P01_G01_bin.54]
MANLPDVAQPAPAFSAPQTDETVVSLADFAGQWLVLYFYPKDNTPGCTTEAKDFTEYIGEFQALGAQVVGVSPDSLGSHAKFTAKHELKLTLLSDPEHQLAEAYGVWGLKKFMGKEYMGIIRSTFLIDPDQKIAKVWTKVRTKGHAAAVLDALKAQQAAQQAEG